jgi:L,D-peptidoglycan transpeptidase YkuD (ErfK/YbiS/YcfS/YnhG family)
MTFTAYADGRFDRAGHWTRCALGPGGVVAAAEKREGDGASPAGLWPMRRVLYRADRRAAPETGLRVEALDPADGWCDAPGDRLYNRHVRLPYPASAERLWRDDGVYDLIVVLGHNDDPVVPGAGSAIFLHLARPDFAPTQGCIALAAEDLEALLRVAWPGDALRISPGRAL